VQPPVTDASQAKGWPQAELARRVTQAGYQITQGDMREDGTRYVLIERVVRRNESSWTVKQYNPAKTFNLSRKEWRKAHLVIGKYNRAS
jgi:hypothetical protein